jgi:hypothetical protein
MQLSLLSLFRVSKHVSLYVCVVMLRTMLLNDVVPSEASIRSRPPNSIVALLAHTEPVQHEVPTKRRASIVSFANRRLVLLGLRTQGRPTEGCQACALNARRWRRSRAVTCIAMRRFCALPSKRGLCLPPYISKVRAMPSASGLAMCGVG